MKLHRRQILKIGAAAVTTALSTPLYAQSAIVTGSRVGRDRVWLRRRGIDEEISIRLLHHDIEAASQALQDISWFFRDWKDNDRAHWIDADLPHVLSEIQVAGSQLRGRDTVIYVNSGYRTPERNATIEGAAAGSLHTVGRASDFTMPGISPSRVARIARSTSAGGIGTYRDFTHVDTGRRRYW